MKIIIPYSVIEHVQDKLPPDCQVVHIDDDGTADGDLHDAVAFLRWWTPRRVYQRILQQAPQLRWVHTPSAGVDGLLVPELLERDIVLTNSAGAHAIPIAEFVMLYILGHAKDVRKLAHVQAADWDAWHERDLAELPGKTVLIYGLGAIGQEVARRAAAFGMRVFGSRRTPQPMANVERVVGTDEWRTLLPETDYLVIATPLTPATRGSVDAAALAALKPGGYVINIARGEIIDTSALLDALRNGHLGGAALDALPEEPLPAEHPLWTAPNCWVTPHISWNSPHTMQRARGFFFENLHRFRAGEPLMNVVDKQAGY